MQPQITDAQGRMKEDKSMSSITRRSFVAGLSTATVGAASVAAAATAPDLSSMVVDGRRVAVDTSSLPQSLIVHYDDGSGWGDRLSVPEPGEYVVLTSEGDLRITPLVEGSTDCRFSADRRMGYVRGSAEGYPPGTNVYCQVHVIGKVV